MRRLTWLALMMLLAATLAPAAAAPVSRGRLAAAQFTLTSSSGGQWRIELTASRTGLGDRLELGVQRCVESCTVVTYYAGTLPAGALRLDDVQAQGSVRATIRGVLLSAAWTPAPDGSVVIGGTHGGGQTDDLAIALHRDDPAVVGLTLGRHSCRGPGYVGDAVQIATGDARRSALPLSALRFPAGALRCSEPEPVP